MIGAPTARSPFIGLDILRSVRLDAEDLPLALLEPLEGSPVALALDPGLAALIGGCALLGSALSLARQCVPGPRECAIGGQHVSGSEGLRRLELDQLCSRRSNASLELVTRGFGVERIAFGRLPLGSRQALADLAGSLYAVEPEVEALHRLHPQD